MSGCLKSVGFFILGLIYLILLANQPSLAIILGASALVVYIFWSKRRKAIAAKEEKRRQQEEEVRRKQAIVSARKRPDLFYFDSSIGTEEIERCAKLRKPIPWAEAIGKRYQTTIAALDDARMVVNDDVDLLYAYREQISNDVLQKYEIAIQPFKPKLLLSNIKTSKPESLKMMERYTFPEKMQPEAIKKSIDVDITPIYNSVSRSTGNYISSRLRNHGSFSNPTPSDFIVLGIQAAILFFSHQRSLSEKRREVAKLQGDVDTQCEKIRVAIGVLGQAASDIQRLHELHDEASKEMMQHYEVVHKLHLQHKSPDDLNKDEVAAVECFYMWGEGLKHLLQVKVMKYTDD